MSFAVVDEAFLVVHAVSFDGVEVKIRTAVARDGSNRLQYRL